MRPTGATRASDGAPLEAATRRLPVRADSRALAWSALKGRYRGVLIHWLLRTSVVVMAESVAGGLTVIGSVPEPRTIGQHQSESKHLGGATRAESSVGGCCALRRSPRNRLKRVGSSASAYFLCACDRLWRSLVFTSTASTRRHRSRPWTARRAPRHRRSRPSIRSPAELAQRSMIRSNSLSARIS